MRHVDEYMDTVQKLAAQQVLYDQIESLAFSLMTLRARFGRLFVLGVGGGAGHASHAVNDFRKLCNIEAYAPTDNVSELTARTNDEGWETVFSKWLHVSNLSENDAIFVFSVGGGNRKKNVSVNIVEAIDYAKKTKADIYGIVGSPDGELAKNADAAVILGGQNNRLFTPIVESFQAVIWHCLVSHPILQVNQTKW